MKPIIIFLALFLPLQPFANRIIVGSGRQFTSIKQAIAVAKDDDTLILQPGLYREGHITITRPLTVIGENGALLDGENKYEIFLLSGKRIRIKNLQLLNAGYSATNDFASIKVVDASDIILENNFINSASFGIHISNSSYITVKNNFITGHATLEQLSGNAIHLWKSNHALIENNYVGGHRDGIYFEFVTFSTIVGNLSEKNIRYGLHFMFSNNDTYRSNTFRNNGAGVAVMYSKSVTMQDNHFEENWGPSTYGILLKDISDSHISHNTFYKNSVGIHMEGSSRMDIERNIFKDNGWALKVQASCDNNNFFHNNFTGNSFDVGTNGSISLNSFYNNYWDKYEGYDLNKDGIGDVSYHPVSLYSVMVEDNPNMLLLMRSFTVQLLDRAERAIPSLTPENLADNKPLMKPLPL